MANRFVLVRTHIEEYIGKMYDCRADMRALVEQGVRVTLMAPVPPDNGLGANGVAILLTDAQKILHSARVWEYVRQEAKLDEI
jgi:hypothetical protein